MADEVSASSPAPGSEADGNAPRRSGRAVRKPITLVEQQNAAKRKRAASSAQDGDGDVDMDEDEEEDEEDASNDSDEEVQPKPKRARKSGKPAVSRKLDVTGKTLPVRPVKSAAPKKPRVKKSARFEDAEDATGLYGMFEWCIWRENALNSILQPKFLQEVELWMT